MNITLFSPRLIKSITSLNQNEFNSLLFDFTKAWNLIESQRPLLRSTAKRSRSVGAGRNGALPAMKSKLLFILFWFKVYPTFDVMGFFFNMNPSQACRWSHRLAPVLEAALKRKLCLPARKTTNFEQTLSSFPELKTFIVDGTDRPIQRPKHGMRRKACYSGRKKRYCIKNIISVTPSRKVVLLGKTRPGSWHDKKCIDKENWKFPHKSTILGDRGFAGYEQPNAEVKTPHRRPNNASTPKKNLPFNKKLAKKRIVVEHAISGIKRSRIVSDILRTRKFAFSDKAMLISCALHNFRIEAKNRS